MAVFRPVPGEPVHPAEHPGSEEDVRRVLETFHLTGEVGRYDSAVCLRRR